jgi:hypothetical protein
MEQTNAEIIGRIDASQVIAFVLGSSSNDMFGNLLQFVGTKEIQEEGIPLRQVERRLEKISQCIGCVGSSHSKLILDKGF